MLPFPICQEQITAKGAQRLQSLASAAADLFLERGFEAVSVDDLIQRVGGSRRNVYSFFGGKEGLFIEAITRLCAELAQPLGSLAISNHETKDGMVFFGEQLLNIVLQPRTLELHRLMVAEGRRFPALAQAVFAAGPSKAAETLAPWIRARQTKRRGSFDSKVSAEVLAEQFVALVVNDVQLKALVGLVRLPMRPSDVRALVSNAVHTFVHGVVQKESR